MRLIDSLEAQTTSFKNIYQCFAFALPQIWVISLI